VLTELDTVAAEPLWWLPNADVAHAPTTKATVSSPAARRSDGRAPLIQIVVQFAPYYGSGKGEALTKAVGRPA
jgi:hypothetical protein